MCFSQHNCATVHFYNNLFNWSVYNNNNYRNVYTNVYYIRSNTLHFIFVIVSVTESSSVATTSSNNRSTTSNSMSLSNIDASSTSMRVTPSTITSSVQLSTAKSRQMII